VIKRIKRWVRRKFKIKCLHCGSENVEYDVDIRGQGAAYSWVTCKDCGYVKRSQIG
jgi:uncharacterized Zn finger protein